jgi:hypothetical protein
MSDSFGSFRRRQIVFDVDGGVIDKQSFLDVD